MRFSFSFAMSLMLWLAVLIYWLESFHSRMDGLQPMVLPLAALGALAPAVFPQLRVIAHAGAWGFQLHFLTAMLAYSLFTLSALHAIFMGFAERKLHQRAVTKSLTSLPPILTMEALLFRMITVAFLLLTVALLSGVMFSEAIFGKAMVLDHKTLFAFASWAIFRRPAGRPSHLRLARPHRAALDAGRIFGAAAGLYGQPLCRRSPAPNTGSQRTSVLTELAMKHSSCAWRCISATSAAVGRRSPEKATSGRSVTRVIASLPSLFFAMTPSGLSA
jgi:hypothetical protein